MMQLYKFILIYKLYLLKRLMYFCRGKRKIMIQRIQTLYLLIAAIAAGGLIFVFSLWKENELTTYAFNLFSSENMLLKMIPIFFIGSSVLSLITIFSFKKRQLQFVLNRLNILINLILLGVLIYYLLMLSGETKVSEKGIGVFIPFVVVLLLVLANRAIYKDENLVKSVDRLR